MSLIRQLWLAVIASTLVAFAGSFVVSMLTARHYLEHQLAVKNADNAASLALSMSQLPKDMVTVELQVAALFDSGQYAAVRLLDPVGKVMLERASPPADGDLPRWFVNLFPIRSAPGHAQVSAGWNQFGTVELVSHSRFAHEELWDGCLRLLTLFGAAGLVIGLAGGRLLKRVKQPLDAVVAQAQAISERRFVTVAVPSTPELKSVAGAMNTMVGRLKAMFDEEAARLEQIRREANLDGLTGLANRPHFIRQLESALADDHAPSSGQLLIVRVADLAGINRRLGRETADDLLRRLGGLLAAEAGAVHGGVAAHLHGADFALLMPGLASAGELAERLLAGLRHLAAAGLIDGERIGHVAAGAYAHAEAPGALLARVDAALAAAEGRGGLAWQAAEAVGACRLASNADWKKLLEGAIASQRLRLIEFPVTGSRGELLHLECPLRLQASDTGEWLAAGSFMPMAARLSLTSELDLAAVRLALEGLAAGQPAVAVNLSGESVMQSHFRQRLLGLLAARRELVPRLWLEVAEQGAFQHFDAFRELCNALRPLGCRLGIEHFGRQFSEIGRLHDVGLDYLKVDGSFVRSIDSQPGNQAFLRGLCGIAHGIGLTVIAEGVQTAGELAALPDLGFDGATGPAVPRG